MTIRTRDIERNASAPSPVGGVIQLPGLDGSVMKSVVQASSATPDPTGLPCPELVFQFVMPEAGATLNTTLDATYGKVQVTDVVFVKTGLTGGASDTVQVKGGATAAAAAAISDAMSTNTIAANTVVRNAQVNQTNCVIPAGGVLQVVGTVTTTGVGGIVTVRCVRSQ